MHSEYVATKETLTEIGGLLAPKHKVYLISDWIEPRSRESASWMQRTLTVCICSDMIITVGWHFIVPVFVSVCQAEWYVHTCTGVHKNACVYTCVYELIPPLLHPWTDSSSAQEPSWMKWTFWQKDSCFHLHHSKLLIVHLNYISFSRFYKKQKNIILAITQCFFGSWKQFGWLRIFSGQTNV